MCVVVGCCFAGGVVHSLSGVAAKKSVEAAKAPSGRYAALTRSSLIC